MLTQLASFLSFSALDKSWGQALTNSTLLGWLASLFNRIRTHFAQSAISGAGSILQQLAFVLSCLLFLVLALPQFANDKGALALLSTAAMVLWIVGRLAGGKEERKFSSVDAIVLTYLAANIIATFSSHYLVQSIKGLSKVAVYIINYFLLTSVLSTPKRLNKLILAAVVAGFVVSLYGLYQYKIGVAPLATWEDPTVESKGTRIYSTLGNPNLLAGYLIPLFPLALALTVNCLVETAGLFKRTYIRWFSASFCFGMAMTIALATVLTGSRGAFLALGGMAFVIVAALFFYVVAKHKKLIAPIVIAMIVAAAAGALLVHFKFPAFESRILSIFAGSEHSSNAYRIYVWRASAKMFMDNWWFGVGPGNSTFPLAYGLYMKSGFDALGTYCVPLEIGVECGLLGIISSLLLTVSLYARAHLTFWQNTNLRWIALGLMAALTGLVVQGLVDTVFYRPQVQFLFWLVVAGLVSISLTPSHKTT
ncbi:MAG: O-antigen ligase family protein [Candidatus Obscuribacterales bacterium]|jgi:putative inorganic carbon (HCO3(-)) transporter